MLADGAFKVFVEKGLQLEGYKYTSLHPSMASKVAGSYKLGDTHKLMEHLSCRLAMAVGRYIRCTYLP